MAILQAQEPTVSDYGTSALEWLSQPTLAAQITGFLLLALASYLSYMIAKRLLLATIGRIVRPRRSNGTTLSRSPGSSSGSQIWLLQWRSTMAWR